MPKKTNDKEQDKENPPDSKKAGKKKEELKPEIKEGNYSEDSVPDLDDDLSQSLTLSGDGEDSDTYFRAVVNNLMDYEQPSTKTEYRNVAENFTGAKLSFLAQYGNIPLLAPFMDIFEIKRISLERKSRKELIMALVEREQEMRRQEENNTKRLLGIR